jgi:hypothetical protein
MHRLLIAAASAAFLAATAAPALADDYPPCSRTVTDHCRVVPMHHMASRHHRRHHVAHHRHHAGHSK